MTETMITPPLWFWIASGAALLWALAGCWACYTQLTMSAENLAKLPEKQREAFTTMPLIPKGAYVIAVGAGLIGALLLLLRNAGAEWAFWVSLAGIIVQFGWFFGPNRGVQKLGWPSTIFPLVIFAICVLEIWLACYARGQGWLQ